LNQLAGFSVAIAFPHDVLNEGDPTLKPSDEVRRYGLNSDGDWSLWAKAAWHKVNSEEVVDKGSFGDRGVKERWIEVKTKTGQEGWVQMEKTTHDRIWHSGTFGDLCILD